MEGIAATRLAWNHSTSKPPVACPLQVVVVGASETGLSALQQLLLHPHLEFTRLTLVAPGGLSGPATAGSYSSSLLARLALDTRVVVLPGRVVALDRAQQLVQLDDGAVVAYDLLLLAAGLQVRHLQCCHTSGLCGCYRSQLPVVPLPDRAL